MKLGQILGATLVVATWALFPGCGKDSPAPALGQLGESCQMHQDCSPELQCINNACTTPSMPTADGGADASVVVVRSQAGESCGARVDCVVPLACINNVCTMDPSSDAGDQTG